MTVKQLLDALPDTITVTATVSKRVFSTGGIGWTGQVDDFEVNGQLVRGNTVNLFLPGAKKGYLSGRVSDPEGLVGRAAAAKDGKGLSFLTGIVVAAEAAAAAAAATEIVVAAAADTEMAAAAE